MKNTMRIKESVRFPDLIDLLIFLVISFFAYSAHFLLKITTPENAEFFVSALSLALDLFINIYFVGHIKELLKSLEEKQAIWFKYLPDRYLRCPHLLSINRWIWLSVLHLLILAYLKWLDSIVIIISYCLLDYMIRKRYIKKAIKVSNRDERNRFLKAYERIHVKEDDLESLLIQGYRDIAGERTDTVRLFCEMFMSYWNERVGEEIDSAQDEFNSAYERIYGITYDCVEDIWIHTEKAIDFNEFLTDFLNGIELLIERDEIYNRYVLKTLLAAVIAFAVFERRKVNQTQIYQELSCREALKRKESAGLWLWCIEFLFQYNEKKETAEVALKPQTLKLYDDNILFSDEKEIDFYRFLWYVWTRRAKRKLSESILNLEELIEYCLKNREGRPDRIIAQKKAKTRSLYILVKKIQPEQEMIL